MASSWNLRKGKLYFFPDNLRGVNEDIEAWKEARKLTKLTYALTREGPFSKDHRLCHQIQSAATSVMANIARPVK